MNKIIVSLVFAAGLGGPAGAATVVHASSTTTAAYSRDAVNNLPDQLDKLQSEVKALRGQVSTLQNISMAQNDESAATLATIGIGG